SRENRSPHPTAPPRPRTGHAVTVPRIRNHRPRGRHRNDRQAERGRDSTAVKVTIGGGGGQFAERIGPAPRGEPPTGGTPRPRGPVPLPHGWPSLGCRKGWCSGGHGRLGPVLRFGRARRAWPDR